MRKSPKESVAPWRVVLIGAVWLTAVLSLSAKPNVVLILTDDHRHDAMGFMGHPFLETPNLDRLASEGVHFKNAYVTTSLCSPSRASILTGLYAHSHGVVDNYHPVRDNLEFFPQHLQKAGYATAFVGKWHMGNTDEPQRGFDHWVSFAGQGVYWPHAEGLKVKGRYVPQANNTGFNINRRREKQKGYITDELTKHALDWLKRQKKETPFFLYLSHKAVHADFLPPNRFAYRYADKPLTPPMTWWEKPEAFTDVPVWVRNQRNSRHGSEFAYYTDLDLGNYYRRYCETLLAVDQSVGEILAQLSKSGHLDNTVVMYLGDNGFLFGEHGLIDKRCAYEESVRIPFLVRAPTLSKPGRRTQIVANIDVAPTVLDMAGMKIPPAIHGRSLLPLIRDENTPWRKDLLYEYFWERNYPQTPTMHAVIGERYKYTRYHGIWDVDELYDIENDPKERRNLINAPEHHDRVKAMNTRLFTLLEETDGGALTLLPDRGTKFHHRKSRGSKRAEFPDWFYREPGTDGK